MDEAAPQTRCRTLRSYFSLNKHATPNLTGGLTVAVLALRMIAIDVAMADSLIIMGGIR